MGKSVVVIAILQWLFCFQAFSNATYLEIAGGTVHIAEPNNEIQMIDEVINISFADTSYSVDVTYTFFNYGSSKELTVGFPQWYTGSTMGESGNFVDFKFLVNNLEMPYSIISQKEASGRSAPVVYKKWYYIKIVFTEGDKIVLRNTYTVPYGGAGPYHYAEYLFGTGKNWYRTIGTMKINIEINGALMIANWGPNTKKAFTHEETGKNRYTLLLNEVEPSENDVIWFCLRKHPVFEGNYALPFYEALPEGVVIRDFELTDEMLMFLPPQELESLKYFYSLVVDRGKPIDEKYKHDFEGVDQLLARTKPAIEFKYLKQNIEKIEYYIQMRKKYSSSP